MRNSGFRHKVKRCEVCKNEAAIKHYRGKHVGELCYLALKRTKNTVGMVIPDWYAKAYE